MFCEAAGFRLKYPTGLLRFNKLDIISYNIQYVNIGIREGTSGTSGEVPGRRTQNGVGHKISWEKI